MTRPDGWQDTVDEVRRKAQGKKTSHTTRVIQAINPGALKEEISAEIAAKIRKLVLSLPHLTDGDVANMLRINASRC